MRSRGRFSSGRISSMSRNFLMIDPEERPEVLRGLASPVRARMLRLLHRKPGLNVNDIAAALELPQSTVSSNLKVLEDSGLIRTETQKGRKGNQKLCFTEYDEVLVLIRDDLSGAQANAIEVAMPIGLYTSCEVTAPCGLCSPAGDHRAAGRAGLVPQSGSHECGADVVHARLRRVSVSEQRAPRRQDDQRARILARTFFRSARHVGRLALRHHGGDQRPRGRRLDEPGRLRRPARRLYARLVEAEGQPVRQAEKLARHRRRRLRRRRENLAAHHFTTSTFPPIIRSACGSR